MADESQAFAKPLAWWGIIEDAVARRASTSELWDAIHGYSQREGITEPPGLFREVNSLRSAASELRNASEAFMVAGGELPLSRDYIGNLPYGRGATAQAVTQEYMVRVGYLAGSSGGVERKYVTLQYSGDTMPGTVGALRADLTAATSAYAGSYGLALIDVESVEIGAW